jgi:hypothetical protein
MRKNRKLLGVSVAVVLAVCLTNGYVAASTFPISDSFTLNDTNREAGDTLNGVTTEAGGATWDAGGVVEFTAAGAITCDLTTAGARAAFVVMPTAWDTIEVSAKINPTGTDWTALTLGNSGLITNFISDVQVFATLNPDGEYQIFWDGNAHWTVKADAPDFVSGDFNDMSLLYNKSENTVTLTINGTVAVNALDLDDDSFTPSITAAGFRFNKPTAGSPQVDDFNLTPEPATMVLLGLGGVGLLIRRRRRS